MENNSVIMDSFISWTTFTLVFFWINIIDETQLHE